MAIDFEALITKHAGEDGSIPAASISKLASQIASAVGREFVAKDRYTAKLDEIETLKAEKAEADDKSASAERWEKKFNALKQDFDAFKADTEAKAKLADIKGAYRKLLESAGIDAKRIDTIIRATSFDGMKLGEDGKLVDADKLQKAIDAEWADFKVTTTTRGADVENPPKGDSGNKANPRAAELARQFHERRYGTAPDGAKTNND